MTTRDAKTQKALERIYAGFGRPVPRPLTDEEEAILDEKIRRAEEELERIYGPDRREADARLQRILDEKRRDAA
ncbi:hypothetical protein WEI85_17435 [Actinomycetes bacterium KLBMP 9797]